MAYKMKNSPLNQFGSLIGSMANLASQQNQAQMPVQPQPQNAFGTSLSGAMSNAATRAMQAQQLQQGTGTMTNTVPTIAAPPKANANTTTRVPKKYNPTKPIRVTGTRVKPAQPIPAAVNPSAMQPAPINPKAIGNPMAVQGIYGDANADTFTRTVPGNEAPIMQLANPELLQDGPQLPPQGVETSITPALGFENN
jgi:cell wall-associated NlpC family hydrolase